MSREQTLEKFRELHIPSVFLGTSDSDKLLEKMNMVFRNVEIWGEVITSLRKEGNLSNRGKSIFYAQNIMYLIEGPIQFYINLILYIILKNEPKGIYD